MLVKFLLYCLTKLIVIIFRLCIRRKVITKITFYDVICVSLLFYSTVYFVTHIKYLQLIATR